MYISLFFVYPSCYWETIIKKIKSLTRTQKKEGLAVKLKEVR